LTFALSMHRFHCPPLDTTTVVLPEEEAHHAVHVLRLRAGDRVGLLNGRGVSAIGELVTVNKREVLAQVLERTEHPRERSATIHLAVAPTKQMDRYEWFVEKAVEIGVDRITPVLTARTERQKLRTDRLERVAISAMKQSQRTWLPKIDAPIELERLLQEESPAQRLFGWCEGEHRPLMNAYTPTSDVLVLIGPEGDFTADEADLLRRHGATAVSLGAARLRTETAALAACTWMSLAQQR
jgi:16S rRNA (uracil1498-N3)-methyltransferase